MVMFFIVLWYISVIAFIVYWRKKVNAKKRIAEFPEKYAKVSKIKRIIGIISIICFILSGLVASYTKPDNPEPVQTVQENKPADPEQVKQDVQAFYSQLCAVDNQVKNLWDTAWVPTMTGLGNGVFSRYDGYGIMKKIEQSYERMGLSMDKQLVVPDSVTGDTKDKLNKVVREYTISISARRDAAGKMLDLLDKGNIKPSELEDVQFHVNIANQSDATAMSTMAEVLQSLGIEATEVPAE